MNYPTNIRSERQTAGAADRLGFFRVTSRWVVEHPGLTTLFAILLVGGLCAGQWWLSYRQAQDWTARHPGEPVPFRLFDTGGWALLISTGIWLALWSLSSKESQLPSPAGHAGWWRFDTRQRQRIFEGHPISRRLLWIFALFGVLGVTLGVALALRLAAATAWQDTMLDRGRGLIGLVILAIGVMVLGARRIRDTMFLLNCDYFVGDRAEELARTIAEEEQAEAEAEREYERKTISGWSYVVLVGGFFGGLFLAFRWLPGDDGNTAFQGSVSGLIMGMATVYLLAMKPRGWKFWLGFALAAAIGFLVFTQEAWHGLVKYLLVGVLWGVSVGVAATLLYLRKLRGNQAGQPDTTP